MSKKPVVPAEPLGLVHPHAAGLDIGAAEIWAAVPPDRDQPSVRPFGTYTPDLPPRVRGSTDWPWSPGWWPAA